MEHHIEGITRISTRSPGSEFSINHRYEILNGYAAHATGASLSRIFSCPEVEYVEADGMVSIYDDLHEAHEGRATGCDGVPAEIRDDRGESGGLEKPVKIFLADTGVYGAHSCFKYKDEDKNKVKDEPDNDKTSRVLETVVYGPYSSEDNNGHGTMMAGRAVGITCGVATSASIVPIKVVSDEGKGEMSDLLAGIHYALQQFQSTDCHAILLISVVFDYNEALNDAVLWAINSGVHVVVPAGSQSKDASLVSPASVFSANTIGAIDDCGHVASFSNVGFVVDVFAPGMKIRVPSTDDSNAWTTRSGTGVAAAFVAGVLASSLRGKKDLVAPALLRTGKAVPDVQGSPEGTTKLRVQIL
ncbi:uncharacterized protein EI90DRAFT_2998575 [Cantharellus anzutake]|uniref:uncharacterized protein n=1 Tax=Cantharellus anzutake TaxID=1750568 RepID=UPI001907AEB3|nr:uncharacterized protein EI90DRAFT_2998575 [Cantharellus anzutake]KAF8327430.1 hypothetical protein EI90DRAFT_2998575 [Cantharellus anzutake]